MPRPPVHPVKPLREYLLQPFHNLGKPEPVRRHNVKHKPVVLKPQGADLERVPPLSLPEHAGEKRQGVGPPEQRLTVVDAGTYPVPDALAKQTQVSYTNIYGIERLFCFNRRRKTREIRTGFYSCLTC
jgi:hypothetical protein